MNDTYGRRGSIAAVWCALAGLAMAMVLAAPLGLFEALVIPYASSVVMGVVVLFVAAWTFGDMAGRAVYARGWSGVWTGWFLAHLCLALAVHGGALVTALVGEGPMVHAWSDAFIADYFFGPLFWVALVGLFPTVWLAWLFARLLARGEHEGQPVRQAQHNARILKHTLVLLGVLIMSLTGLCLAA